MADLIRLPERRAVQRHFDDINSSVLRWGLIVTLPGSLAGLITSLTVGRTVLALLWGAALLANLLVLVGRRWGLFDRFARQLLLAYLTIHATAAVLSVPAGDPEPAYVFAGYLFPTVLMLFRMRWTETLSLGLLFAGTAAWLIFRGDFGSGEASRIGLLIGITIYGAIAQAISLRLTRRRQRSFLVGWRHEVARDQEESRMRGELMDAREIQLSMLPRATPELAWLDASGFSVPASEVGGDYYEYFRLDADRLVLVIGDVAGHGVASGLVLSGVRSGLHLLRDELADPVTVVQRLNRMVRETAPRRMFVTFQIALLDRKRATVTVANAGHPPILLLPGGTGPSRLLGESGLPLGTRLDARYEAARERLGEGDVLIFYTDGVIEASDLAGEEFGEEKLRREAERLAPGASAGKIREGIISAVSRFKGDAAQIDDVTLVALRVGDLAPYTSAEAPVL